jgi:hypothetical protein
MENIKEVLKKLEENDMHVHETDHSDGINGYKGMGVPIAHAINSTHFIMKGAEIVYVGNLTTVESFALRL